ncbi:hypothetical protein AK812_SmicGene30868 [Symbiodinium microadriaticum]|uniref:Uncharacterized protein n=1 Tax=Symbiodinium microadriaticum TaxID=2951 RepID=A0A1Q9CY80_SYMMI|nr:hypothetical protein AK812_SmicGene30868 [Symbiodinium microadriaticum]
MLPLATLFFNCVHVRVRAERAETHATAAAVPEQADEGGRAVAWTLPAVLRGWPFHFDMISARFVVAAGMIAADLLLLQPAGTTWRQLRLLRAALACAAKKYAWLESESQETARDMNVMSQPKRWRVDPCGG